MLYCYIFFGFCGISICSVYFGEILGEFDVYLACQTTQWAKTQELQQQQQHQHQKPQQHQQMQMQQLFLRRHAHQQQQPRDRNQLPNGNANGLVSSDTLMRRNPATANAMATKMYEQRLKLPLQRDALDDGAVKQRLGDNVGQLLYPNHAAMLKAAAVGGQHPGQTLHGTPGGNSGNLQQVQNRSQQLPGHMQDGKSEMNSMMNPITAGPDGTSIGVQGGLNQGSNNLTLKGWPLTLRSGLLQQQKSLMQSPQSLNQLQLQQQLMCQLDSVGDIVPNTGSLVQVGCPLLPCTDKELLLKLQQQQLQNNNQHKQHYLQYPLSSQQSQSSNHHLQQQDKMNGAISMTTDGVIPNNFQGNDQAPKSKIGQKRKQPASSSGPANSSGTTNTTGPSPSSPSSPSAHTPEDMMSMPSLPHNVGSSKSLFMFGSDGMGSLMSASNQLADIDCFMDDGSLGDNVDSFLSRDDGQCSDVSKGLTITKIRLIPASTSKVECCHFSSDGKLLATGGHDRKAVLWCTESFAMKSTLEEHSQWITDVRFSPSMSRLATCSADKTVRVWNTDNPGYSLRTFTGHSTAVLSLDFHPSKEDLLCSCDNNSEIRYWSIKNGSCAGVFKGGATQMRFQPRLGRLLAAASGDLVTVLDVETQVCMLKLQGHKNLVHSVCWDPSGECLASLSDDLVRVWTVGSGNKGECIHELRSTGNKFNTCVFHPTYHSLLVIGCYETLELWNTSENKTISVHAHDKLISALAVSSVTGLVASASHDKCVKLWK